MALTLTSEGQSVVVKSGWLHRWSALDEMVADVGEGEAAWTYTSLTALRKWARLNGYMDRGTVGETIAFYSDVAAILEFMMPTSEEWRLHTYMDSEDEKVRASHYERLTAALRKSRPEPYKSYLARETGGFHNNLNVGERHYNSRRAEAVLYNAYLLHTAEEGLREGPIKWSCIRWEDLITIADDWDLVTVGQGQIAATDEDLDNWVTSDEARLGKPNPLDTSCKLPYVLLAMAPPRTKRIGVFSIASESEVTKEVFSLAIEYVTKLGAEHLNELIETLFIDEAFLGMTRVPMDRPLLHTVGYMLMSKVNWKSPKESAEAILSSYGRKTLSVYTRVVEEASNLIHTRRELPSRMKAFAEAARALLAE